MSEVSDSAHERSRKAYSAVLHGMKDIRQVAIAWRSISLALWVDAYESHKPRY